jgi:hypothetical protein
MPLMGNSGAPIFRVLSQSPEKFIFAKELNIASVSELTAKEMKLCGSIWNKEREECAIQTQMEVEGKEHGRTL